MKGKSWKLLLMVAVLSLVSGSVYAQEDGGMSFGVDEAEAVTEVVSGPSPVAGLLAEGKKLYNEEKYLEASQKFYAVMQNESPAAQIDKADAQYQMAKVLFRLGLFQSSLNYYRQITDYGETHPFFLPAINGLVELTDIISEDPNLSERLKYYLPYYPKDVPKKYRDRFAYLVGRSMDQADPEKAIRLLQDVSPSSPDYAKAQYIAGVSHISLYNAKEGVKNFRNSLRVLTEKRAAGKLSADEVRLLELGYLALARTYYSTGQFDTAIKYYSRIDRTSDNWPVSLFESSWAYFQTDNYNQALGNLQSLNSPFFQDRFFPEGPILSAVLYFYNCRYDRVRAILDDFAYEYEPLQQEVQKLIDRYSQDFDAGYRWLINARTEEVENPEMARVVSAAVNDKLIRDKLKFLLSIDRELNALSQLPEDFQNSAVGKALKEGAESDRTNTKFDVGELAVQRLDRVNRSLQDLIIEQKKILFEVDRSERGEIEADLRAELAVAAGGVTEYKAESTPEQLVWVFDGEYWRDELGHYVVSTSSQCKR